MACAGIIGAAVQTDSSPSLPRLLELDNAAGRYHYYVRLTTHIRRSSNSFDLTCPSTTPDTTSTSTLGYFPGTDDIVVTLMGSEFHAHLYCKRS